MSYRVYVNNFQIFGNNEGYTKWDDFIKSQGIEIKDGCYDGYITDVMGAIKVLEEIVMDEEAKQQKRINKYDFSKHDEEINRRFGPSSLFDLTNIPYKINNHPDDYFLLDELIQIKENGYMFLPLTFLNACNDMIEKSHHDDDSYRYYNFKIKEGCKIHVYAR